MAQPHPATFGDTIAFPHLHRHPDGVTHVHAHTHADGHALSFSDRYVHHHPHGDTDMAHRDTQPDTDQLPDGHPDIFPDPNRNEWATYIFANIRALSFAVTDSDRDIAERDVAAVIVDAIDARIADCDPTGDTPPDRVTVNRGDLDALRVAGDEFVVYGRSHRLYDAAQRLISSAD